MHHRGPQTFITVHISSADICKICVYSLCLGFQFSVSEYGLDKLSFSLSPPQHGASERFQRPGQKFGVKCEGCLRVWGSWQDFRSVEMEIRSRLLDVPGCHPGGKIGVCRNWPNFKIATSIYSPSLFTQICFVTLSSPFAWTDALKHSKQSNPKRPVEMELIDELARLSRQTYCETMKSACCGWNEPNQLIGFQRQSVMNKLDY